MILLAVNPPQSRRGSAMMEPVEAKAAAFEGGFSISVQRSLRPAGSRQAALHEIAQFAPSLPADKGAARPTQGSSRSDHQQRDPGGNHNFRITAQPPGASDGTVSAGKGWRQASRVTTKVHTQALGGDL